VLSEVVKNTSGSKIDSVIDSSGDGLNPSIDEYAKLQRRIILVTLLVSVITASIVALFFDLYFAGSLLVGGFSGVLYLWLLARSIEKLGNGSRNLSKTQLLVPVVLFFAALRLPQLELLPAMLGFLLYKPGMIMQALLDF